MGWEVWRWVGGPTVPCTAQEGGGGSSERGGRFTRILAAIAAIAASEAAEPHGKHPREAARKGRNGTGPIRSGPKKTETESRGTGGIWCEVPYVTRRCLSGVGRWRRGSRQGCPGGSYLSTSLTEKPAPPCLAHLPAERSWSTGVSWDHFTRTISSFVIDASTMFMGVQPHLGLHPGCGPKAAACGPKAAVDPIEPKKGLPGKQNKHKFGPELK